MATLQSGTQLFLQKLPHPVPAVCGTVLLAAVGLKSHAILTGVPLTTSSAVPEWAAPLLVACEIGLGCWLLAGWRPRTARIVALLFFAGFAGVNALMVWEGRPSCGCFGRVAIEPRYVLAFDLMAFVALLAWLPRCGVAGCLIYDRATARPVLAFIAALATLTVSVTVVSRGGRTADGLRVKVEPREHDFGEVAAGSRLTHRFTLSNSTGQTLEVVGVKSTCSCSTADGLVGVTVEPGARIEVPVTMRVAEDEDRQAGDISVYFRAGPAGIPAVRTVRVLATPRPEYRVEPRSRFIDFGVSGAPRTVRLEPVLNRDARFVSATTSDARLTVRLADDGRAAEVAITGSGATSGDISAVVMLATNSPRLPTVPVYVQGECPKSVEVRPRAIVVPSDRAGVFECDLEVECARPSLAIREVVCSDVNVRAELLSPTAATGRRVRLSVLEFGPTVYTGELVLVLLC